MDDGYLYVAAIDFGTAYSGYAFAFNDDVTKKIYMNKNWSGGSFESYKTPTSILFGPGGFEEFGYDAEYEYCRNTENFDLFRHFKMMLHHENISKSFELVSLNGRARLAMDVFSEALIFLRNHMIAAINKSIGSTVDGKMVRWVVTIPAIWKDDAKQFMREAAFKAGLMETLHSSQLVLALEPEVASLYCREIPVDTTVASPEVTKVSGLKFEHGREYLIIDAGGGTVDITAHRALKNGFVKEILEPCGGPWGGVRVDKAFEQLLKEVLGEDIVTGLQKNAELWLKLMLSFEVAKKGIDSRKNSTYISLDMHYQFCKTYTELSGRSLERYLPPSRNSRICFNNGRLVLSHEASVGLFIPTVTTIVTYVKNLFLRSALANISHVLLVGGFGTCEILQSHLKQSLPPNINLVVPSEAQLAIVKGAVQFGLNSNLVESRFARKTYGIDIEPRFKKEVHDPNKKVVKDDVEYCRDVFLKFIDKGTPVNTDEVTCRTLRARTADQPNMCFDIFCCDDTDLKDVEYVSDPKFTRIGGLTVFMPSQEGGIDREVEVRFRFGGTEILVSAKDLTSGETANTAVDMLVP